MKHLKIYEDFDLEKFLEDPSGNIHDDEDPEISPGDWITSYRGIGQVLEMPRKSGLIKIQLINGPRSIISIPANLAVKIKKEEAELSLSRFPETVEELEKIYSEIQNYSESIGSYDGKPVVNNPESSIDFLEDILMRLIEIKSKDSYSIYHKEYSSILMSFGSLVDIIMSSTENRNLIEKLRKINDSLYKLSE